ncbi:MAG: Asp-tRNA(Asn)/Glu-tRNA(Gln) amidotransferase subunit GatB [Actinomycetota bacterium]|nr:Asp-tRNA(Asn)/Glu-tRNA(Gln) amidotransferase subunit GatB [Actinomycetota bacterium]
MSGDWELVVGLEVHVELNTATKMFCGCATDFGAPPNTRICPVCVGLPGALPVVNVSAVEAATRLGLALNCTVAESCLFHRKNYFYPDLAKNYQVSQYDVPLCTDGWLEVAVDDRGDDRVAGRGDRVDGPGNVRGDRAAQAGGDGLVRVGIERVHMEEDTGKSLHVGATGRLHGADRTLIDYNRSGIALLECVSRPDLRGPEQAQAYLRELQGVVRALGISDAKMEEGSMRCDANVSVRRISEPFGTRCEIKNLNSTRSLGRAIAYEAERQIHVLESAGEIVQETRHWDEDRGVTETLRRKEAVTDYRYFPDPDLVEVVSLGEEVTRLRGTLPELPAAARARLGEAGVDAGFSAVIVAAGLLPWFDEAIAAGADPRSASIWLTGEVVAQLNLRGLSPEESGLSGAHIAELIRLVQDGTLSTTLAKDVLDSVFELDGGKSPAQIAAERGLEQLSDVTELRELVEQVIARNPAIVAKIRGGADKAIGALVGQIMRETRGKANPQLTSELLRQAIEVE